MFGSNKKIFYKYSNTSKKILLVFLLLVFCFFLYTRYEFFVDYKNKAIEKAKNEYTLNIKYLNLQIKEYLLLNDKNKINRLITESFESKFFKSIYIKYDNFIFNKNTLIFKSKEFNDKTWILGDISIDARYGYIEKINDTLLYQFFTYKKSNSTSIDLRFQAFKKKDIDYFFARLDFTPINRSYSDTKNSNLYLFFDKIFTINVERKVLEHNLTLDNKQFAKIKYEVDTSIVKHEIYDLLFELILISLILFIPIVLFIIFYHKFVFKKYVKNPLHYLNIYLDNILINKYAILDKGKFENFKEFEFLTKKISKIARRIAGLNNELNITKEIMDRKMSTDVLTGLVNRSIFDLDIKSMFINSTPGVIYTFKLEALYLMNKNYDNSYINSFIKEYINNIKNTIFKYDKLDTTLYRFYGSEFAIISKNISNDLAIKMLSEIISNLEKDVSDKFDLNDNSIHFGACVFDVYGNANSVLELAYKAYEAAKQNSSNAYHFIDDKESKIKLDNLLDDVKEIISTKNITIKTKDSIYLFDNDKLVMKELSALVYDKNGDKISIGSFLTIASHLQMSDDFDKIMIEKSIEFLKEINSSYSLIINISFDSISKKSFMIWLNHILEKNSSLKKNLIFSITSFSAYSNRTLFKKFCSKINSFGSKILIKRYKLDEYPLDELKGINIDYIRMSKEYTDNFSLDSNKKHKVKNILIYAELNNLEIISDNVNLDEDLLLLERLGTYARTK